MEGVTASCVKLKVFVISVLRGMCVNTNGGSNSKLCKIESVCDKRVEMCMNTNGGSNSKLCKIERVCDKRVERNVCEYNWRE
jgi:hypothetical protein